MATCGHGVEYGKCLICFREWLAPKITLICPFCASNAAELTRLRSLAERAEDVEGLVRALYLAAENLDSDMGRWAATYDDLEEKGKRKWRMFARSVAAYLKGEK